MHGQSSWYQEGLVGTAAETYERYMVPSIFAPWADVLLDLAALRAGERVLDVACGTGVVTRRVAACVEPAGKVVGLDLNADMVAYARSQPPSPGAPIEWEQGDATAMPFPDGAFDVVLCQQGLQFFADRAAGLREMRRVLAPGGRLALNTWRPIEHSPGFAALADALARHVAPGLLAGPFSLGSAEETRALLVGANFHAVTIRPAAKALRFPSVDAFVRRYVAATPLAAPVARAGDRALEALIDDVSVSLRSFVDADGLLFPIESHLTLASA